MSEEIMAIDSNSYYGAVIYINPQIWENGKKMYRFDIVKQKNGQVIDTIAVDYATCPGYALAHAIDAIDKKKKEIKKQWRKDR